MRIETGIRRFITDNFVGAKAFLERDSSFAEDGFLDGAAMMQLADFIAEHYSISVAEEEIVAENFDSLHRIVSFVERKRCLVPVGVNVSR